MLIKNKLISNRFKLFDSDSLKSFHKRVFFSITVFIFLFGVSIYRLSDIMIFIEKIEIVNTNYEDVIRGNIFDKNGYLLATSIKSRSISINPSKIKNKTELVTKLSKILDINEKELKKNLNLDKKFVWIKRNISPKEYQNIINLGEINIKTHYEYKRVYPYRNTTSHLVGFVNIDQKGQSGIERYFENELKNSNNIFLSVDVRLQQLVRKNLLQSINKYQADSGVAIIMDVNNGNILSSVSLPDFNPENNKYFIDNNLINRVVQANYEMGSTFKPITATMGYDLDIIKPEMTFDVRKKFRGIIGDHQKFKDNGIYDVERVIVESSNIGTAQIATLIGKKNQNYFFNKLGFDEKINIEIKESAKPLGNKNNWGPIETATIGFGHGYSITPLHLIKAYAILSNGGYEVHPTLVSNNNSKNNKNIFNKLDSSAFFLKLLNSVITKTNFTGPRVKINGYEIGGKTGTSEIVNPNGGYYKNRNLTSFIGVFPIDKPKYVVFTAIEYPKKGDSINQKMTGAVVNAPLVRNIIKDMINLYNIPQEINDEYLKADTNIIYKKINVPI